MKPEGTYDQTVAKPLGERKGDISHGVDRDGEHVVLVGVGAAGEVPVFNEGELGELHDSAIEERAEEENQEDDDKVGDICPVVGALGLLPEKGGTLDEEDEESTVRDAREKRALQPGFFCENVRSWLIRPPWI